MNEDGNKVVFALVSNIPKEYHSVDLRNFFSEEVENESFVCFHFIHRPQINSLTQLHESEELKEANQKTKHDFCCCVIKLKEEQFKTILEKFDGKCWTTKEEGTNMKTKCCIKRIKINEDNLRDESNHCNTLSKDDVSTNQSRSLRALLELDKRSRNARHRQRKISSIAQNRFCIKNAFDKDSEKLTLDDLTSLRELNPPDVMPHGNVGTPTKNFLSLIRECRLPPKIINKLGLEFPRSLKRRFYSNVEYDYGTPTVLGNISLRDFAKTKQGHLITDVYDEEGPIAKDRKKPNSDHPSGEGNEDESESEISSEEEEWDRHESLNHDVTQQERTRERLFEEEQEVTWEKGGSGLVFYTDAHYWDLEDGDFDAKTADDLDVDMSVYFNKNGGDKDAHDLVAMRNESMLRAGEDTNKSELFKKSIKKKSSGKKVGNIGSFEKHTKGIGRSIMEKLGWKEGDGLGRSIIGRAEPIDDAGQKPFDKRGFGYRGEKLGAAFNSAKRQNVSNDSGFVSTIYDKPNETQLNGTLLRSAAPTNLKFRR